MPPLVTIAIINHNYGAFLAAAIDSALAQDHAAIEVVVVDDGSTDNSRQVIASYGERICPVFGPNAGHAAAVNLAFAQSTGEFVLFLDADDLLFPTCVSAALAALAPGDAKIQFQLATIDRVGVDQDMPFPYFPQGLSPAQVLEQSLRSGWYPWTVSSGNLFARWFLEQLLPVDVSRIYRSPDGYLNKLAPLFGAVRTLPRVLGAYRVHGGNAWASNGGGWDVGVALRWLRFDQALECAFLGCARARGVATRTPLLPSFHQLEYRLLALRLAGETPIAGDGRIAVLSDSVRWLFGVRPDGWIGGLARVAWLCVVAFAPAPVLRRHAWKARTQSSRPRIWQRALRMTRRR